MILYMDTSALVKRYFEEEMAQDTVKKCREADLMATSCVAYAEALSAIYRKAREESINSGTLSMLVDTLEAEWDGFFRIPVNDSLNSIIKTLGANYPLRGFDSIHLASALLLQSRVSEQVVFACFDEKLVSAASSEGLKIFPQH
ncbi:MAG: VapC toxin family PIN domain ribonuclease [Deltaproteobacteria bacterium]|nr:MAG: VapC toxin family PIN domain ribonuclease [Deltaproteobacteria bacterium]